MAWEQAGNTAGVGLVSTDLFLVGWDVKSFGWVWRGSYTVSGSNRFGWRLESLPFSQLVLTSRGQQGAQKEV